jgi:hypothetical protein
LKTLWNRIARAGTSTWNNWPQQAYERPTYRSRLSAVKQHLSDALDLAPEGEITIISLCAGDGRDVIEVASVHPRRCDVAAWLVEADARSVAAGIALARGTGLLKTVRFLQTDATSYATYRDIPRADVVMLCGVWGHVPPEERSALVRACSALCREGGHVIWTRGLRRGIERFEEVRAAFSDRDWSEARATITPDGKWAVATNCLTTSPPPRPQSGSIFHFQTAAG